MEGKRGPLLQTRPWESRGERHLHGICCEDGHGGRCTRAIARRLGARGRSPRATTTLYSGRGSATTANMAARQQRQARRRRRRALAAAARRGPAACVARRKVVATRGSLWSGSMSWPGGTWTITRRLEAQGRSPHAAATLDSRLSSAKTADMVARRRRQTRQRRPGTSWPDGSAWIKIFVCKKIPTLMSPAYWESSRMW